MSKKIHDQAEVPELGAASGSVIEDWQVIHSARYILEDLNHEKGMQALAELSGLPMGVITAAFRNIFPPNSPVLAPEERGS